MISFTKHQVFICQFKSIIINREIWIIKSVWTYGFVLLSCNSYFHRSLNHSIDSFKALRRFKQIFKEHFLWWKRWIIIISLFYILPLFDFVMRWSFWTREIRSDVDHLSDIDNFFFNWSRSLSVNYWLFHCDLSSNNYLSRVKWLDAQQWVWWVIIGDCLSSQIGKS